MYIQGSPTAIYSHQTLRRTRSVIIKTSNYTGFSMIEISMRVFVRIWAGVEVCSLFGHYPQNSKKKSQTGSREAALRG